MSKEMWIDAYEKLESELEREPTDEEVNERYRDDFANKIDTYRDRMKYEPIIKKDKV